MAACMSLMYRWPASALVTPTGGNTVARLTKTRGVSHVSDQSDDRRHHHHDESYGPPAPRAGRDVARPARDAYRLAHPLTRAGDGPVGPASRATGWSGAVRTTP